jgi:hypothetical protein
VVLIALSAPFEEMLFVSRKGANITHLPALAQGFAGHRALATGWRLRKSHPTIYMKIFIVWGYQIGKKKRDGGCRAVSNHQRRMEEY